MMPICCGDVLATYLEDLRHHPVQAHRKLLRVSSRPAYCGKRSNPYSHAKASDIPNRPTGTFLVL